ncbi:MAG: ferredoxin [Bacilli bacterium]|nr:ferredoxin [Bacilli bacterium]
MAKYKVKVDQESCIGCGACCANFEFFEFNDDGVSTVKGKTEDIVEGEDIEEAANVCPVDAIKVEKAEEK